TGVGIIQVVMGVASVKKDGLLNQPLPKDLRQKIYVFLGSRCTNGDVVEARYQGHVAFTSGAIISSVLWGHKTRARVVSIYQQRLLHARTKSTSFQRLPCNLLRAAQRATGYGTSARESSIRRNS